MRREEAAPIYEILEQTPAIPDSCQWGLFLRNHDELTLEMVTDEERDYMYAEYAKDPRMKLNLGIRRRLAPLLDNGRDEIELMTAILFSLPGSPVLYYGDEIAMGDNIFLGDRDGVRTPMQWTGDRNGGFSRADFAQLYAPPLMDPGVRLSRRSTSRPSCARRPRCCAGCTASSRCARSIRCSASAPTSRSRPPTRGSSPHMRRFEDDLVLCVHNLARSAQAVELDLSALRGPLSGRAVRPLALPADRRAAVPADARPARLLLVPAGRGGRGGDRDELSPCRARPSDADRAASTSRRSRDWLEEQRWYASKSRHVTGIEIDESVCAGATSPPLLLALVQARFATGSHELYQLPLGAPAAGDDARRRERDRARPTSGRSYDALSPSPSTAASCCARSTPAAEIETDDGTLSLPAASTA